MFARVRDIGPSSSSVFIKLSVCNNNAPQLAMMYFIYTFFSCVSIQDFKALKDDVRTLKDDVRRLKRKLNSDQLQHPETKKSMSLTTLTPRKLGTQITLNSSAQTAEKSVTPRKLTPRTSPRKLTPRKSSPTPSPPREVTTPPHGMLYNSLTRSQLVDAISHTDGLYTAVKILILMLFPESYILSHSITGKPSNSKVEAKPPFDTRLYNILLTIIKEKYGLSAKEITAKVHSVQKWVQKKSKTTPRP